jgi:hypothetical protein
LEDQKKLDEQLEKADIPTKRRQKDEKIREKNALVQLDRDVQTLEGIYNQVADKLTRIKTIERRWYDEIQISTMDQPFALFAAVYRYAADRGEDGRNSFPCR